MRTLYPTKCKCGKSSTNFFNKVGLFYIDECCTQAGYDHLGNLIISEPPPKMSPSPYRTKPIRKYNKSGKFKTKEDSDENE